VGSLAVAELVEIGPQGVHTHPNPPQPQLL